MAKLSRISLKCVIMVTLAACVAVPETPTSAENTCGAAALQVLVRQSAKVLETMRFGKTVRFIRPGTPVTKDYRPNRLNIFIDAKEKISRVTCG